MESPIPVNMVDLAALIAVVIGLLQGRFRGLSGELARLISLVCAFLAGLAMLDPVSEWVLEYTRLSGRAASVLAFVAVFLGAVLGMFILRSLLRSIMRVVIEEKYDKALGCLAGGIRMTVLVLAIIILMNLWPNETLNRTFGEDSFTGSWILRAMPALREGRSNTTDDDESSAAANDEKSESEPRRGRTSRRSHIL